MTLKSILRGGGICFALAFTLLLAGCGTPLAYNDPNIPADQRYFNTVGVQSTTAAQPIQSTAAQPAETTGIHPVNSSGVPPTPVTVTSNAPFMPGGGQSSSRLGVGDLLTINFSDVPNDRMPREVQQRIGDDGLIILPHNVQVKALGKTPTQLQQEIRKAYVPDLYVNLTVTVKAQDRFVYVDGEVKVPGRQFYIEGLTVLRAISTAGGFTDFANKAKIEVRRFGSGKTETVNWKKAQSNPKLDLPLLVNDLVFVHRGIW